MGRYVVFAPQMRDWAMVKIAPINDKDHRKEMDQWCDDNATGRWSYEHCKLRWKPIPPGTRPEHRFASSATYFFKSVRDATLFKLTFGGGV